MIAEKQNRYKISRKDIKEICSREPGVYLFRDRKDRIIYVGKAKNIRKRVSSYFKPVQELTQKTAMMMSRAKYLEYILTDTENEAFILESTLIKRHMPRYNIVLRDDKQYPYLKIRNDEPYPRLEFVRKMKNDGAMYFGPYSSAGAVRGTMKLIDRIFRLRKCRKNSMKQRTRPCLNYQLDRCLAPCTFNVSVEEYQDIVKKVKMFLEGRSRELIKHLREDMKEFAAQERYEDAARVRDQIRAVERTIEKQNVISLNREDQDIIGIARREGVSQVVVFFLRKGFITGSRDFRFEIDDVSPSEIIEAFLKQFYLNNRYIPGNILISHPVDDLSSIMEWLSHTAGKKITIHHPIRGKKVGLVSLAVKNAENLLSKNDVINSKILLESAKSLLNLKKVPRRMEAIDISNLQGHQAVGTIVSFVDALPDKSGYRNYKIKGVEGIDDYEMMSEVVTRRLSGENPPDLFVIDGGKGHLLAVKRVMDQLSLEERPELIAIAKEREQGVKGDKIYLVGRKNPLRLNSEHPVLLLLMRVRDEVHRRAVTYHRKIRGKNVRRSLLDEITGIGPAKKKLLLKKFGDIDSIKHASVGELMKVRGISEMNAKDIFEFFLKGVE